MLSRLYRSWPRSKAQSVSTLTLPSSPTTRNRTFPVGRPVSLMTPVRWLTNQQIQLADIQTSLAIVLPSQIERAEPVLVGSKGAIDLLVQIDEAALDHEEDQCGFW